MASTSGVLVDDNVLEVLRTAQLDDFVNKFVFLFNVRRFDHFSHVRDKDMQDIGMQQQQIRQFREQILKMSREMWNRSDPKQVYVAADQSTPVQSSIDEKALIPYEQIKLHEQLGKGFFAVVKRGTWVKDNGVRVDVAVKILRDVSSNFMGDFNVETSHLLKLQHPSVIRLYGIVRQPAMMVFELCEGGSLLDRLRDDKKPIPPVSLLLNYCIQTARALQFLESKNCVHRDVAARNILLSKNEKITKLSDFGLTITLDDNADFYTMSKPEKVATAWCAPETLRHGRFSYASDVWSYGVLLWELFTFGEHPWDGCTAEDILRNIDAGERLEKPEFCSEEIHQVMKATWKTNPHLRCEIGELEDELTTIYEKSIGSAETNRAVATAAAVTPQKVTTAPTVKIQQTIQPTVVPYSRKPLNTSTPMEELQASPTASTSRPMLVAPTDSDAEIDEQDVEIDEQDAEIDEQDAEIDEQDSEKIEFSFFVDLSRSSELRATRQEHKQPSTSGSPSIVQRFIKIWKDTLWPNKCSCCKHRCTSISKRRSKNSEKTKVAGPSDSVV
ncbi:unnamed protein product [Caenorhabditis brenneri]